MADTIGQRFKRGWDAFSRKEKDTYVPEIGVASYGGSARPFRTSRRTVSKDSVIVPIYNRIAIDVAAVDVKHVRVDKNQRFVEDMDTELNSCLMLSPNIDQTSSAFFRDVVMTMCEVGAVAIVPVESKGNPLFGDSYDPSQLRVGEVVEWFPKHVRLRVYNDHTGLPEELVLPKRVVAIVENPLYAVMNEPNSTLQRLLDKLRLLDVVDEQSSSGKLDILIQLPYVIKSEARQAQAERRRRDLEEQLTGSKYGIAYTDGSERVTQLNRPAENNLLAQVEYLTNMLYGQLGLTPEIISGTANEAAMLNYFSRTIEPFLTAITQAMTKTFISRTGLTQGQRVKFFRDPFKLVPVAQLADIADKFTRNEIASSNDMRAAIGWQPSTDPKADELRNANISAPKEMVPGSASSMDISEPIDESGLDPEVSNEAAGLGSEMDSLMAMIDKMISDVGGEDDDENQ